MPAVAFSKLVHTITTVVMLLALSACQDQSGRAGRPLITDFTRAPADTGGEDCTRFISSDFTQCLNTCPDNQHVATEDELTGIIEGLRQTLGIDATKEAELLELASASQGVCVDDIIRPNGKIKINSDYCGCKNTTPLILNNCANFCASQFTNNEEVLFVNVTLDPEIALNPDLGTLRNWCTKEIGDGNTNPNCVLEFFDGVGFRTETITNFTGAKSFTAELKNIPQNVTFVARIVETTSGASSDFFQVRKFTTTTSSEITQGPLRIHPASMYTCITRSGQGTADGILFTQAVRLHFFFSPNDPPPSLPPLGTGAIYCHDIELLGINDSPLHPRLELIPQHFSVWDINDPRFADTDGNAKEDINDILQRRLLNEYGVTQNLKIFGVLNWPNVIPFASSGGSTSSGTAPKMGYFMQPWVNSQTGTGFCPTQAHYNGADPVFRVMKEHIGVDTEGIFLAEREPLVIANADGTLATAPADVMIIRENLLKKIWFYFENGKHFVPDDFSAANKTIMYYWPPDINNPYTRKSTQFIYTVRSPETIGQAAGSSGSGLATSVKPPDKRFGCVPSLGQPQ